MTCWAACAAGGADTKPKAANLLTCMSGRLRHVAGNMVGQDDAQSRCEDLSTAAFFSLRCAWRQGSTLRGEGVPWPVRRAVGGQVDAAGPYEGSSLRVDGDFGEVGGVVQWRQDTGPLLRGEVDVSGCAVAEEEAEHAVTDHSDTYDDGQVVLVHGLDVTPAGRYPAEARSAGLAPSSPGSHHREGQPIPGRIEEPWVEAVGQHLARRPRPRRGGQRGRRESVPLGEPAGSSTVDHNPVKGADTRHEPTLAGVAIGFRGDADPCRDWRNPTAQASTQSVSANGKTWREAVTQRCFRSSTASVSVQPGPIEVVIMTHVIRTAPLRSPHGRGQRRQVPRRQPVEVRYPRTRQEELGDRSGWPWLPGWTIRADIPLGR